MTYVDNPLVNSKAVVWGRFHMTDAYYHFCDCKENTFLSENPADASDHWRISSI